MPIKLSKDNLEFPPVEMADYNGLLAMGGDLSPERLLKAYSSGIFPWYEDHYPILWWSPDPRFVLFPDEVIISKSMRKVFNKKIFKFSFDKNFREVIENCRNIRVNNYPGTWITLDMVEAYCKLHELGYVHSLEVWHNGEIVGGLYGVSLGKVFFGESMFTKFENASKAALIVLCKELKKKGFLVIDSQVQNKHMKNMGGRNIPRNKYLELLKEGLKYETLIGNWSNYFDLSEYNN